VSEPRAPGDLSRRIADAFIAACRDELDAPKPGNVHVFADGHRMAAADFMRSADAAADPLTASGVPVGARILAAVEATFSHVGTNTNLGIILLCAPLAAAAESQPHDLRASLARVLHALDVEDAAAAFRAIARASPAGLGEVEHHDVRAAATVTLRAAMAEAAGRDRIARQYVTDFADVFDVGEPLLDAALGALPDRRSATLATFLGFLAAFPDSHICRKYGIGTAERVRRQASWLRVRALAAPRLDDVLPELLAWDKELKDSGINPGTSADLTVATLFVHRLRSILPSGLNSA
jgi:triphosphoribosyl-dephospho-CoA synthase